LAKISRRGAVAVTSALVLAIALFLTRATWLTWLGSCLVYENGPWRADIIVVLGGDFRGTRVLKAAELAWEGYAPQVMVSGIESIYGYHESDLAVAWAVEHGYRKDLFVKFRAPVNSTREEAQAVVAELRRRGIHRFLLVTSNYHTHRATTIFHEESPDIPFHTVASPYWAFRPDAWWKTRDGQKCFAGEWTRTVAAWLHI
jgi:uncharacterized SAM-binding protein YcdF (DUF218 family)